MKCDCLLQQSIRFCRFSISHMQPGIGFCSHSENLIEISLSPSSEVLHLQDHFPYETDFVKRPKS